MNLKQLLPLLGALDYPDYEVVIIDDGSTDGTPDVIRAAAVLDNRVRHVRVAPAEPRKKHALTAGIAAARHDLLVLTDADCHPLPGWLREIAAHHDQAVPERIVTGYGPYHKAPTVLNSVARYENLLTSFLTAAACGLGRPYMAVGRNLSYRRELFDAVDGLSATMMSLSGDDDLFVQHAVTTAGAEVVHMFTPASAVFSPAPKSWRSWYRQKRRHASAGRHYGSRIQAHLLAFHVSALALWLAPVFLGWIGGGLLAVRMLTHHLAIRNAAIVCGERDLLRLQPLWEMSYALYNALIAPFGVLFQPVAWRTGSDR